MSDLHHFLDLPEGSPAPAQRLAGHLAAIVQAGTSGDANVAWMTALPCRRRPGNRACSGRLISSRPEPTAAIRWHCHACGDEGIISNWEHSIHDLRRRTPTLVEPVSEIMVSDEVASALRDLRLLDTDTERVVYAMRGTAEGVMLVATDDGLEDLIGAVAAETNHETNRRRRKLLDTAFDALDDAGRG